MRRGLYTSDFSSVQFSSVQKNIGRFTHRRIEKKSSDKLRLLS